MGGQIEVIVGREHDGRLAVHLAAGNVGAFEGRRLPQQGLLIEFVKASFHPRHVAGHGASPTLPDARCFKVFCLLMAQRPIAEEAFHQSQRLPLI